MLRTRRHRAAKGLPHRASLAAALLGLFSGCGGRVLPDQGVLPGEAVDGGGTASALGNSSGVPATIAVHLIFPSEIVVSTLSYSLFDGSGYRKLSTMSVPGNEVITFIDFFVSDVSTGEYTLGVATAGNGSASCDASTVVDVIAGQQSSVTLTAQCTGSVSVPLATPQIDGPAPAQSTSPAASSAPSTPIRCSPWH